MSESDLITLLAWARARYDPPPHRNTLRRWVHAAKIVPVPKKNGRSYFVSRHARYIDYNDPNYVDAIAESLSEPAKANRG